MAKYRLHTSLPDDVAERFQRFAGTFPGRALWYVIEAMLDAVDGRMRFVRHLVRGAINNHRGSEAADAAAHARQLAIAEELHRCGDTARAQQLRASVAELAQTLGVRARATAALDGAMDGQPAAPQSVQLISAAAAAAADMIPRPGGPAAG